MSESGTLGVFPFTGVDSEERRTVGFEVGPYRQVVRWDSGAGAAVERTDDTFGGTTYPRGAVGSSGRPGITFRVGIRGVLLGSGLGTCRGPT